MKHLILSETGDKIPIIGLGTWQAPAAAVEFTVEKALELGYRHIDTAFNYNNEAVIGNVIKKWLDSGKGTREELFITTKLPHVGNRASDVKKFLKLQLERLQIDYVDLYIIHVPFGFKCNPETLEPIVKENGDYDLDMETDHVSTWKVMEECQKEGLIRNLGLSNFNEHQIKCIMEMATIKPQVLQVEVHALCQQEALRKFCTEHNITVTAYAPLGSPGAPNHFAKKYQFSLAESLPDMITHPKMVELAEKYNKTVAQILLRFLVQQNIVVIPKTTSEERLNENINILDFELSQADVEVMKSFDMGENGRIFNFLFWKGVDTHPEYPFKK